MVVAGVASARARLYEEGYGGLALEDEDYSKQARVPGVIVKVRGDKSGQSSRVPLPERFRCNGLQHHCKSKKKEVNGEDPDFGEEATVEGKPKQRASQPMPMPAGTMRPAGASSGPVQANQANGAVIGENGVVMGKPARRADSRGPFHDYVSASLGKEVTAIYYTLRVDDPRSSRASSCQAGKRQSQSSSSGTRTEKLEEGPDGMDNYPFVPGMQLFVDLEEADATENPHRSTQSCTGCAVM